MKEVTQKVNLVKDKYMKYPISMPQHLNKKTTPICDGRCFETIASMNYWRPTSGSYSEIENTKFMDSSATTYSESDISLDKTIITLRRSKRVRNKKMLSNEQLLQFATYFNHRASVQIQLKLTVFHMAQQGLMASNSNIKREEFFTTASIFIKI